MALKLGEMLVQEGLLTPAQLDEALKYQVIFGGRLGTNLIEMGFVKEADVSRFLGRKMGVTCLDPAELSDIPDNVIQVIPQELAARFKVIPLRLENRRLTLAMVDPTDLKTLDEISFRTGLVIRPAVAPEIRILQALEKYYQIERGLRYIQASKKLETASRQEEPDILQRLMEEREQTMSAAPQPAASPQPEPEPVFVPLADTLEDLAPQPAPPAKAQTPAPPQPKPQPPAPQPQSRPVAPAPPAAPVAARPAPPAAKPAPVAPAKTAPPPRPATVPPPPKLQPAPPVQPAAAPAPAPAAAKIPARPPMDMDEASRRLADARDRDDIAEILAAYLGREFPRAALFLIHGSQARAWRGMADGKDVAGFNHLQISLDEPSVLKTVADSKSFHLGPLPRAPFNSMIIQELGGEMPDTALVVPLTMVGRVVVILYVDGRKINLGDRLPDLQKLIAKASMAFEILVLKNKIVSL